MIKAVVDQGQVWEPVLIEIGSDVLGVGSMIILLKTEVTYRKTTVWTDTTNV